MTDEPDHDAENDEDVTMYTLDTECTLIVTLEG